jgi:hypothetical protein
MLGFLWNLFVAAIIIAAPVLVLTCFLVGAAELCRRGRRRRAAARVDWDAELRDLVP